MSDLQDLQERILGGYFGRAIRELPDRDDYQIIAFDAKRGQWWCSLVSASYWGATMQEAINKAEAAEGLYLSPILSEFRIYPWTGGDPRIDEIAHAVLAEGEANTDLMFLDLTNLFESRLAAQGIALSHHEVQDRLLYLVETTEPGGKR